MAQNLGNLFIDGESTIEDETGNHTLSTTGTVALSSIEQKYGTSSIHISRDSFISAPASSDWEMISSTNFTLDFWFKFDSHNAGNRDVMFSVVNGGIYWYLWMNNSKMVFQAYHPSYSSDTINLDSIDDYTLLDGEWHHCAVVKSGGSVYTLYADGIAKKSEDKSVSYTINAPLQIGQFNTNTTWDVDCHFDNIRITSDEALWTENFDLTEEALFYTEAEENPYVRPDLITGLYSIGSRGNLRGKAAEGFIRPTIKQFFTSSPDFKEITSGVSATGGIITEVGGYRIHTFLTDGTLDVSTAGEVECLVVAGGGGAGGSGYTGGGGAGGLIYNNNFTVSAKEYFITVGSGGAGGSGYNAGTNGSNSIFDSLISIGGGGGGSNLTSSSSGGSGGGGCGYVDYRDGSTGTAGQGNAGGDGSSYPPYPVSGGGGGGAGEAGAVGAANGGKGGDGLSYSISGSSVYYAGGGGGGTREANPGTPGLGGLGGGADGKGYTNGSVGNDGAANTGGGGGGIASDTGGSGGSGIVIIRYAI